MNNSGHGYSEGGEVPKLTKEQAIELEAEKYADSIDRRGCSFWRGLRIGYIAAATGSVSAPKPDLEKVANIYEELIETHRYKEKLLKQSIKELLPMAQWGFDLLVPFDKKHMAEEWPEKIDRAKSIIQ